MAAIGVAWADGAWVEAGWASGAWSDVSYAWTLPDRHTIHRLPVAENYAGNLEYSSRLALANVPLAGADTDVPADALNLEVDDDFALLGMPHPVGFTVVTRSGLTIAPRILESDSVNRDGTVTPTLSTFAFDFDGTVTNPSIDGALSATLSGFTPSFVGEFGFRHYLDISYSITPTWVVLEQPARFGDIDATLGGFTVAYTGYALPPDSTQGSLSPTLSAFTADFDGTYTAPPSYDGRVSLDIAAFSTDFDGSAVPPLGIVGALSTTLDGFTTDFDGTFAVFSTDGAWASTLSDFTLSIQGQFIDASTNNGAFQTTMDGFDCGFTGVGPLSITLTAKEATFLAARRPRDFVARRRKRDFN